MSMVVFRTMKHLTIEYMLPDLVHYPDVRLDINAILFFNIHLNGVKRAGYDVSPTLRKFHAGPFLPFRTRATYGHRFMTGLDDLRSNTCMNSQPRVERQAFVSFPRDVIVNTS